MATNTATKTTSTTTVKAIPDGYHTITPGIIVNDAVAAIDFYKKALGATELMRMACQDTGKVMHAELKVGDSVFSICNAMEGMCGATSSSFYLYVNDCQAAFDRAQASGMTVKMPVTDMFWGDKMGKLQDQFGNSWAFATHTKDLTNEQIMAGQKAFAEQMKKQMGGSCSSGKKA